MNYDQLCSSYFVIFVQLCFKSWWSIRDNLYLFAFHLLEEVFCGSHCFNQAHSLILEVVHAIVILQELGTEDPIFFSFLHVHSSHRLWDEKKSRIIRFIWINFHVGMFWELHFLGLTVLAADQVELNAGQSEELFQSSP